ncbi:hypothetical protein [Actinomycetospora cinnamomea]|uniref:DoxX-like protein n=1 Tax=Actinomycetospora cinnamomea TaxID=663609 RepID=A0A2U1F279_9PSEU|nr:hypothetical protein [Actinomycetospora cinnamomea]PVZ06272.1 hypothetical protein C8D89_11310 [Actinomycetospora cinnamomea]
MVAGSATNVFLLSTRPAVYAELGDWLPAPDALHQLWDATLGEHPLLWVPGVGIAYELLVGVLALLPRRRLRFLGLAGIALFHLGLLAMGLWAWALPVMALIGAVVALEVRGAAGEA